MRKCKVRRALYARLSDITVMRRIGSFKAAFYAFDTHEATCPPCQHEPFAIQPAPWRRHGSKRLTWRFRFPVLAYNLRRGKYHPAPLKPAAYEPASIWYRLGGGR